MLLGKLPVPGRPTVLDYGRARSYCAYSRCGWWLFGYFFSHLSFLSSFFTLWETVRYRLKYCLKGPLSAKQPTNVRQCTYERGIFHLNRKTNCLRNQSRTKGEVHCKLVEAPSNFIAGRPEAALLFRFFGGFRCDMWLCFVRYKSRKR